MSNIKKIALISTGGTIEKTYDALHGVLLNGTNVLDIMLAQLKLKGIMMTRIPLMNKDSLDMNDDDHTLIARTAEAMASIYDGVVIVHGTDRLQYSGERTLTQIPEPRVPIIFTGALRPFELRRTDAVQNLTESLLAVQLLQPGVYLSIHNQILKFPGVYKENGVFLQRPV